MGRVAGLMVFLTVAITFLVCGSAFACASALKACAAALETGTATAGGIGGIVAVHVALLVLACEGGMGGGMAACVGGVAGFVVSNAVAVTFLIGGLGGGAIAHDIAAPRAVLVAVGSAGPLSEGLAHGHTAGKKEGGCHQGNGGEPGGEGRTGVRFHNSSFDADLRGSIQFFHWPGHAGMPDALAARWRELKGGLSA